MTQSEKKLLLKSLKSKLDKNPSFSFIQATHRLLGNPIPTKNLFEEYPELEKVYVNTKNNPKDEKNLSWEKWQSEMIDNPIHVYQFSDKISKEKNVDLKKYPSEISINFTSVIAAKVNGFYQDGVLKYVSAFSDIDMNKINFGLSGKLALIITEHAEKSDLMHNGFDEDLDSKQDFEEEVIKLNLFYTEQMQYVICDTLSVKKESFTTWELELLVLNVKAITRVSADTAFSKDSL